MRFVELHVADRHSIAVQDVGSSLEELTNGQPGCSSLLDRIVQADREGIEAAATLRAGDVVDPASISFDVPFTSRGGITCIRLNDCGRAAEGGTQQPDHSFSFTCSSSSLTAETSQACASLPRTSWTMWANWSPPSARAAAASRGTAPWTTPRAARFPTTRSPPSLVAFRPTGRAALGSAAAKARFCRRYASCRQACP